MTDKEIFIQEVKNFFNTQNVAEEAKAYFEQFCKKEEKPAFTESGAKILAFMKANKAECDNVFTTKAIANGLFCSGRVISGAIRKLINEGYVGKIGDEPVRYALTALGDAAQIELD